MADNNPSTENNLLQTSTNLGQIMWIMEMNIWLLEHLFWIFKYLTFTFDYSAISGNAQKFISCDKNSLLGRNHISTATTNCFILPYNQIIERNNQIIKYSNIQNINCVDLSKVGRHWQYLWIWFSVLSSNIIEKCTPQIYVKQVMTTSKLHTKFCSSLINPCSSHLFGKISFGMT